MRVMNCVPFIDFQSLGNGCAAVQQEKEERLHFFFKNRDSFHPSRNFIFQYFIIPSCLPTFLYFKRILSMCACMTVERKELPSFYEFVHIQKSVHNFHIKLLFCYLTLARFYFTKCYRTLATHPLWHEAKPSLCKRNITVATSFPSCCLPSLEPCNK